MKERILRRRTRARASAGFTLIELMVVVVLIAALAMLAAPSMVRARADRLAFSFARQVSQLIHSARSRAAGRGGAHLVVYIQNPSAGAGRGAVRIFEALDGSNGASNPVGPNPSPNCRRPNQWNFATAWVPNTTDAANLSALVDALDINATGSDSVIVQENITMTAAFSARNSEDAPAPVNAFVLCTTPNGTTYFGQGGTVAAAITAMQASTTPFTDIVEVDVSRRNTSNANIGLKRRVIVAGASAPRIKSE